MIKQETFVINETTYKSFDQLSNMHIEDLRNAKAAILSAIEEQQKERNFLIGQILFYQKMHKENK